MSVHHPAHIWSNKRTHTKTKKLWRSLYHPFIHSFTLDRYLIKYFIHSFTLDRYLIKSSISHCGAASTARACSSVTLKWKAACLSVYTYKLTSYMSLSLWAILQENYREEYGLQTPTEPWHRSSWLWIQTMYCIIWLLEQQITQLLNEWASSFFTSSYLWCDWGMFLRPPQMALIVRSQKWKSFLSEVEHIFFVLVQEMLPRVCTL